MQPSLLQLEQVEIVPYLFKDATENDEILVICGYRVTISKSEKGLEKDKMENYGYETDDEGNYICNAHIILMCDSIFSE